MAQNYSKFLSCMFLLNPGVALMMMMKTEENGHLTMNAEVVLTGKGEKENFNWMRLSNWLRNAE
jgi:hypothetical protein